MLENLNYDVMGDIWQLKRDGYGLKQGFLTLYPTSLKSVHRE